MTCLESAFCCFTPKHTKIPVIMYQTPLANWYRETFGMPTRQVEKIELCSGVTSGKDDWGINIGNSERHHFLRAHLEPTAYRPEEVVLFERIKAIDGFYHSVIPLTGLWPTGGSFLHPQILDLACTVEQGSSDDIIHKLEVERSLELDSLTVQELGAIFELVGLSKKLGSLDALGCTNMSGFFVFMCLAVLAPTSPPPPKHRTRKSRSKVTSDRAFLEEESWFVLDQLLWMTQ